MANGINVTQAKYYIITDGNIYSMILTKKLKKLVKKIAQLSLPKLV